MFWMFVNVSCFPFDVWMQPGKMYTPNLLCIPKFDSLDVTPTRGGDLYIYRYIYIYGEYLVTRELQNFVSGCCRLLLKLALALLPEPLDCKTVLFYL